MISVNVTGGRRGFQWTIVLTGSWLLLQEIMTTVAAYCMW